MVFSYGLVYGIGIWAGWDLGAGVLLLLALACAGIFYGRIALKKRRVPVDGALLALAVCLVLWVIFAKSGRAYAANLFSCFAAWRFSGALDLRYGWPFVVLLLVAAAALYHGLARYVWAKLALSAAILAVLVWQACEEAPWELLPAIALFSVALDGLFDAYEQLAKKDKNRKTTDFLPVLLMTLLLLALFPVREEPVSWERVGHMASEAGRSVNELFVRFAYGEGSGEFSVERAGFSGEENGFWGRLVDNEKRELLRLDTYTGNGTQERYFAGNIREVFEGDRWSSLEAGEAERAYGEQGESGLPLDTGEHMYHLYASGIGQVEGERFCQLHVYTFEYESLRTRVLFVPANACRIAAGEEAVETGAAGLPCFVDKQGKGSLYQVSAFSVNMQNENLLAYLRGEAVPQSEEGTLFEECVTRANLSEETVAWIQGPSARELFAAREREVYERDLQLPDDFSGELLALAGELTEGAASDYDRVQAIRAWLQSEGGFTYTTAVSEVPEGRSVMEYFLLDKREGYCTYFATAMTLLCRSAGIPARYVEGITVGYGEAEDGSYPVWGGDAHAWTQVYLKGYGWVDVDATPGYGGRQANWREPSGSHERTTVPEIVETGESGTEAAKEETAEAASNHRGLFVGVLVFACAAVLVFFLMLLAGKALACLSYRRSGSRRKAELLMRSLLDSLKKQGLPLRPDETLRTYLERIEGARENGREYRELFAWYEGIRYGGLPIAEEDIGRLETLCRAEKKRAAAMRRRRLGEAAGRVVLRVRGN